MGCSYVKQHTNTIFSAYSTVQWGLTQLQRHSPSTAGKIFSIQQWMMVTDLVEVGYKGYRLHQIVKYGNTQANQPQKQNADLDIDELDDKEKKLQLKREKQFFIAFAVGMISIACFVYFTRRLSTPNVDLKSLCTDKMTLSWEVTPAQIFIQFLFLTRIATNVALGYMTGEKQHFLQAGLQSHSFLTVQQLNWIRMQASYTRPLNDVPHTRENRERNYARSIQRVSLAIDFLCPPTCTQNIHYEDAAKRIKALGTDLFVGSHWRNYSYYETHIIGDSSYSVKRFVNEVTVKFKNMSLSCCTQPLHISYSDIRIADRFLDTGQRLSKIIFSK